MGQPYSLPRRIQKGRKREATSLSCMTLPWAVWDTTVPKVFVLWHSALVGDHPSPVPRDFSKLLHQFQISANPSDVTLVPLIKQSPNPPGRSALQEGQKDMEVSRGSGPER